MIVILNNFYYICIYEYVGENVSIGGWEWFIKCS